MRQKVGSTAAGHSCFPMRLIRVIFVVVFVCCIPSAIEACLWDHDTLQQERSRFPSTLELITGKFLRHSPEFYQWRITDRLARLKSDPTNLALHDDLAVAYQKIGQQSKAIEFMEAKEKIKPGLYETYSNLGTFHILAGDFKTGLPLIDKALAINPDAHFGREKYQKWLVEYALLRQEDGKTKFPMRFRNFSSETGQIPGFRKLVERKWKQERKPGGNDQEAVKGMLGMMRFANHENPLLLEALGDLLIDMNNNSDGKQLAARCYLKASYVMKDESARKAYREFAEQALTMQLRDPKRHDQLRLADLESQFKAELAQADQWYAKLRSKELEWIKEGRNADTEFEGLYSREPRVEMPRTTGGNMLTSVGMVAAVFSGLLLWHWRRSHGMTAANIS